MKKALSVLLLLLMCASAFACTPTTPPESSTDTENPAGQTQPSGSDPAQTEAEAKTEQSPSDEQTTEQPPEPEQPSPVALYQLAPEKNSLMQSYVIKTENGKLIVIDGGIDGEGKDRAPYLPAALRSIMGIGKDDYFEVEAWFLSHAHKDHMYELSKMLSEYSADSNYKINNIYFDFPEFGSDEYPATNADMEISQIRENINKYGQVIGAKVPEGSTYYDQINGAVINADAVSKGLSFEIDGVRIDVLQTWDKADGTSNLNDTSLVLRAIIGEQSVLFLNDLGTLGGRRLLTTYGQALKSDIVQMAHHGQAGVTKDVYQAIDAQVRLWPTPIWVWKNASGIYQIDEVRKWVYGKNFLDCDEYDIVACLYPKYPTLPTEVKSWNRVINLMKIEFPYVLPERPIETTEAETVEPFVPVEHSYVKDGLVAYYCGTQSTRDGHDKDSDEWEDLVGGYDMVITKNNNNYFTDQGLRASKARHEFPSAIVDTVNGESFTIEVLLGDFTSLGSNFNTFISSSDDHFALFRRNSENVLELKTLGNGRIKIKGGLELLQNSLITIVYTQNSECCIYVNGELAGQINTAAGSLSAGNFFIGHSDSTKTFDTTYRAVRFYNRALRADEVKANAVVDGYGSTDGQ